MKLKRIIFIFMASALSIYLPSCREAAIESANGGIINVCVSPYALNLDPALNETNIISVYLANAFSGLYSYKNEKGKLIIQPECATEIIEPTLLDNGMYKYIFKLRDDLRWSDGKSVTASDFEYAWNRAADLKTSSRFQYMFEIIDVNNNSKLNIEANDEEKTLTVITKSFCPYFNHLMAFPIFFPVRKEIVEANPDGWSLNAQTYVSNGPFKLEKFDVANDQLIFIKNSEYWDKSHVILNKIIFKINDNDDENFQSFESGELVFLYNIPITKISELMSERLGKDFYICQSYGTYYLAFNKNISFKPGNYKADSRESSWEGWNPEKNAQVRLALSLLIDRSLLTSQVLQGGQIPANGFIPTGMSDGNGNIFREKALAWWDNSTVEGNKSEAIRILKNLGFSFDEASGKFKNFPSLVFTTIDSSSNMALAEAIQSIWKDSGIEVDINKEEQSIYNEDMKNGKFDVASANVISEVDDPTIFFEIFSPDSEKDYMQGDNSIASLNTVTKSRENYISEGSFQEDFFTFKNETDRARRSQLAYQFEKKIHDELPILPIYFYTKPYLMNQALMNVVVSPYGLVSFKSAYLSKEIYTP